MDICKGSDVCNKTNGECLNGCKYPGYQAPECIPGKWYSRKYVCPEWTTLSGKKILNVCLYFHVQIFIDLPPRDDKK